jgi:hypothetical protein
MSEELRWWRLWGEYAGALVAATTLERAIEIANTHERSKGRGPFISPDDEPSERPGPPTAEGLYHFFAE